ncbi:unannotated protein [freshwater metagenome]|uniref:Unannotated protein n=1 Tax=freshwater metagenome TaxID=449393 RepID=A0A6J7KT05_9ZZZZ
MDFAAAIKAGWLKWNQFSGTASKSEFWYFYLFLWILGQVVNLADMFIQPALRNQQAILGDGTTLLTADQYLQLIPIPSLIISLVTLIPSLSLTYRRIQDGGRSGKLAFLQFIPLVLGIVFIISALSALPALLATGTFHSNLALLILGSMVLFVITGIIWLVYWWIWMLAPTKTAAQGNRFATN